MNEEVLLLMLKLLRKVRNAIPILRVCENLISLVTFIATEIQENKNSGCSQCLHKE